VVFVSHDRSFVSRTATRIVEVTPTGLRDFPGSYDEYLERCGDDHLDSDTVLLKAKRERKEKETQSQAVAASTGDWEVQKRERNRRKELPARRDRLEKDIDAAEAEKQRLLEKQCSPGYYERTTKQDVQVLTNELVAISEKIDTLIAEWEAVETELATLG
jgi:ATPase subunit of ABC transporter with duplicated ATPase domains